jgi:signal transduction histidine kinase
MAPLSPEFVAGALCALALLGAFGYLLRRQSIVLADLEAERDALLAGTQAMRDQLVSMHAEITEIVHQTVDPVIDALDDAMAQQMDASTLGTMRILMGDIVDQQLRPLSHELANDAWLEPQTPVHAGSGGAALCTRLDCSNVLAALPWRSRRAAMTLRHERATLEAIKRELRQEIFIARRHLGVLIHGPVQSALHAAALRLGTCAHPDPAFLASIRTDISAAIAKLNEPQLPYVQLISTLSDITELWDGTCQVRWVLDHQTVRSLAESPIGAATVAEVTRECITNAIRHGSASEIQVAINRGDGVVHLTVRDNGRGTPPDAPTGLGTQLLHEVCQHWTRTSDGFGTVVEAAIGTPREARTAVHEELRGIPAMNTADGA